MKNCSFEACGEESRARGLCGGHYQQNNRGEHLRVIHRWKTLEEFFEANTSKSDGCWNWIGSTDMNGYGVIRRFGMRAYAHRHSYAQANGTVPDGLLVDHICHNPRCVKPAHLRLADKKRNAENYTGNLPTNTSGHRGVHWNRVDGRWHVQVTHHGKRHSGGTHADLEAASEAAKALRNKLHTFNELDRV